MKRILKVLMLFLIPNYCLAQSGQVVIDSALKKGREEVKKTLYSSNGKSNIFNPISNFSVNSQFDKGTSGKIDLSLPFDKTKWTQLNLSAEQKITSGTTEASPFNLEGISPNSTISIGFQSMLWHPNTTSMKFKEYYEKVGKEYLKNHSGYTMSTLMYSDLDEETKSKLGKHTIQQPLFFNIKFSVSKSNFKYATDSINLKVISENSINTSLSTSIMKVLSTNRLQQIISLNFRYDNYYKGTDAKDFLMKFGTTTNYVSKNVAFGAPQTKSDKLFSLEYKMGKFNDSNNFVFGLDPSATYSINAKQLALQLPIYFIPSKDEKKNFIGLNGGISLGYLTSTENDNWSSFKNGFAFEIFVGLPFNVFDNK
jgi:hypothetical protein